MRVVRSCISVILVAVDIFEGFAICVGISKDNWSIYILTEGFGNKDYSRFYLKLIVERRRMLMSYMRVEDQMFS